MKIGIIREGKTPPDSRVIFTPDQCKIIQEKYNIQCFVQPSPGRCIADSAYEEKGIVLREDLSDCDVLMGIKEVPIDQLIEGKTYFFFSHTIKEQPYNRTLLQEIIKKNIRLIDYEVLTRKTGGRVIAFGRFAGIVGAHNGVMAYGRKTGYFHLDQMNRYTTLKNAIKAYNDLELPNIKIVLTGTGRVANGAAEVLDHMGILKVSPKDFLNQSYNQAVYTQLACKDYVAPIDMDKPYDQKDFYTNPSSYRSIFAPYLSVSDLMINGIYWDNDAPAFFSQKDIESSDFNIQVIADVTCDIAPVSSIPSTLKAATIADPVFGYDRQTHSITEPYQSNTLDMMTVDNLPNELPIDASQSFGEQFMETVIEELLGISDTGMIDRATIALNGHLGSHFKYLENYVSGE